MLTTLIKIHEDTTPVILAAGGITLIWGIVTLILALLAILGMGAVTYATRIGGFWLLGRVTPTKRVEAWMRAIPGAVLVSLIAPALLAAGVVGFIAAAATVVIAARTHRLLPALVAGVVIVAVARLVFHAG